MPGPGRPPFGPGPGMPGPGPGGQHGHFSMYPAIVSMVGSGPYTIYPSTNGTRVLFPAQAIVKYGTAIRQLPGNGNEPTGAFLLQEDGWYLVRYQFRATREYTAGGPPTYHHGMELDPDVNGRDFHDPRDHHDHKKCKNVNAVVFPLLNGKQYRGLQKMDITKCDYLYQNSDRPIFLKKGTKLSFRVYAMDDNKPFMKLRDFGITILQVNNPNHHGPHFDDGKWQPFESSARQDFISGKLDFSQLEWQDYSAAAQDDWQGGGAPYNGDYSDADYPDADYRDSGYSDANYPDETFDYNEGADF